VRLASGAKFAVIDTFLAGPRRVPLDEWTRAQLASLMQGLP
jgi:hypothetical protein